MLSNVKRFARIVNRIRPQISRRLKSNHCTKTHIKTHKKIDRYLCQMTKTERIRTTTKDKSKTLSNEYLLVAKKFKED